MQKFEPVNDTVFAGLISYYQNDLNLVIKCKANDIDYQNSNYNISRMFTLNSIFPSAFDSTSIDKVIIDIEFINRTFLPTHYQLQQRTDEDNAAGSFLQWIVEGRTENLEWTRIDVGTEDPYKRGRISFRKTNNFLVNKLRFTFFHAHVTIQQMELYGVLSNFSGFEEAYKCKTCKNINMHNIPYFYLCCIIYL